MRKEKSMWLRAGMLGALVALLVFGVGGESSAQPKEIKIGVVSSLTGPGYGYGQRSLLAIRYRVEEEINKSGGINGHPVKLFIYDTATRADQSAMLVERAAVVDKVVAILGPDASSDVAAALPAAKRLGVPDIGMGGVVRGLIEPNAPWGFSTMISQDFFTESQGLLIDQYKVKTMIMMADAKYNYAVGQMEEGYKIAAKKNVKVLNEKGKLDVETGWADFTPQITRIKSLNPELIYVCLFAPDLAHFAIALKGAGIDANKTPIWGCLVHSPEFITAGGAAAEGWYGTVNFNPASDDPVQKVWVQKLTDYGKTITSDPGIYTVLNNQAAGYGAAVFLCEAIRRTKITPDTPLQEAREKIRDELPKIRMKTYGSREVYFGQGGRYEKNRVVEPTFLVQIKGGKWVTVGTVE